MEPIILSVFGFLCSVLIGFTLGTIGAGGSILTVPVLVYLMNIDPVMATSYSLFIVGATSLTGALRYTRKSLVDFRSVFVFGLPSIIIVYLIRHYLIPWIPETLYTADGLIITKDKFFMFLFAAAMLVAGASMLRKRKLEESSYAKNYSVVFLSSLVVGVITGMVGIGGGFIIVPVLVLFAGVGIRYAIGTSLFIIAMNSFSGFAGEHHRYQIIDWKFLVVFCLFSFIGIIAGESTAQKLSGQKLKRLFSWFIIVLGGIILLHELEIIQLINF